MGERCVVFDETFTQNKPDLLDSSKVFHLVLCDFDITDVITIVLIKEGFTS